MSESNTTTVVNAIPTFAELCQASVPWYGVLDADQRAALEAEFQDSGMDLVEYVYDLSEYESWAEFSGESILEPEAPTAESAPQETATPATYVHKPVSYAEFGSMMCVATTPGQNANNGPGWFERATETERRLLYAAHTLEPMPADEFCEGSDNYADAGAMLSELAACQHSSNDPGVLADELVKYRAKLNAECVKLFHTAAGELVSKPTPSVPVVVPEPVVDTQAALVAVNKTLAAFGKACESQAEANYRIGALAAKYVAEFLAVSPKAKRSVAVDNLAEEMRLHDVDAMGQSVDAARKRLRERVNLLLRVNAVVTLIGDGTTGPKSKPLAWGIIRQVAPLVDETADGWVILSGLEDKSRALVASLASKPAKGLRDVVKAEVDAMLADRTAVLALEAKAKRELADKAVADKTAAMRELQAEADRKAAEVAALAAKPDVAPEVVVAAKVELASTQQQLGTAVQDNLAAMTARLTALQIEDQAVAKANAQADKLAQKTDAGKPKASSNRAPVDPTGAGNILSPAAIGKAGSVKDVAAMVAELVSGNDDPLGVLTEALRLLSTDKALCKTAKAACQSGLVVCTRKPERNGVKVA